MFWIDSLQEACTKTLETYGVGACGPRGFYGTIGMFNSKIVPNFE